MNYSFNRADRFKCMWSVENLISTNCFVIAYTIAHREKNKLKQAEIDREGKSRQGFPGNGINLFILDQTIKLDFS